MKNSLMKKYESMGFDKGQLEEIRQGVEKGLDVSWYTSVKYDWFQMEEIKKGLERGLDVSVYAREELTYDRMRQIRKGLQDGIPVPVGRLPASDTQGKAGECEYFSLYPERV